MKNFYCHKPWENILVEVNGDCYFCCFIIRPGGRIGNLKKDTLDEAWTSRKANKIRKFIAKGKIPYCCQICPYYGEFKHEKFFFYKIFFIISKTKDLLVDFWQGGFTRYRLNLKIKEIKKRLR
jgi:radical SAM protein with 4Fe4S-binding SPASM domain